MLIDNEEDILKSQKEPVFESIVYTCNKTFSVDSSSGIILIK